MVLETSGSIDEEVQCIVDRAVQRDPEAFGQLYDLYLDPIYRYLYFRLGNTAEAEDLSEAVFLKAWEGIHRFRWQGKPFVAWLYRVAHNVLVDYFRSRRKTEPLDRSNGHSHVQQSDWLHQQQVSMDLASAIQQLTEEQQQVIILKFLEGWDNSDIATITGKREGAIRALQLRALRSLQRIVGSQES